MDVVHLLSRTVLYFEALRWRECGGGVHELVLACTHPITIGLGVSK